MSRISLNNDDIGNTAESKPLLSKYTTFPNLESTPRSSISRSCGKTCPTCKGTGKVDRDQENQLIALIPLSDKRLKPKRIWLWILITVLFCIIMALISCYLLAPREITLQNNLVTLKPTNITYIKDTLTNNTIGLIINFNTQYEIRNKNFYQVSIRNLLLDINRNSHSTQPKLTYEQDTKIAPRSTQSVRIGISYAIYSNYDPYANLCLSGSLNDLFSMISATFSFSTLWTNNQQSRIDLMQYIVCRNVSSDHFY